MIDINLHTDTTRLNVTTDDGARLQLTPQRAVQVALQTNTDILAAIRAIGIPVVTIKETDNVSSKTLDPNTVYLFPDRTSNLTLTLGTPITGKASEYHLFITIPAGTTPVPTVTYPAGITWNGGSAPTLAAGKTCEISILNNVAAFFIV